MLDGFRRHEKNQNEDHDEKYEPHGQRCVISALRKLEQVTETSSRCNKLPNDGTRESKTDSHFETAEHPGSDGRNIDFSEQDHTSAPKCAYSIDQKLMDILDSAIHREKHQHCDENDRKGDLGRKFDAKPDYE